ncbi:hypothetical protein L6452_42832 [Arctium lappa]|uniref:Uncharacterized protein n=1 Tax=Arctium lappa TaxID=4217 RepID=A0ACB8XJD3_ARCLA|nr:hypothetical protein L6452_42832 [Arctium lappa]
MTHQLQTSEGEIGEGATDGDDRRRRPVERDVRSRRLRRSRRGLPKSNECPDSKNVIRPKKPNSEYKNPFTSLFVCNPPSRQSAVSASRTSDFILFFATLFDLHFFTFNSMASNDPEHKEEETAAVEDEDTGAQVAPIVKLEEVAVTTGEENEDAILDLKAKLYRFDKDGNQWKERGAGSVKFLKHKQTGKVRLVMRQSKTLKICANHLVIPTMSVQEHAGNDKSCVWHATDFSDGELKDELFCIRFGSIDNCKKFIETFQEVAESQKGKEENKEASVAAGLLENLSVEDKKEEEEPKGSSDEPEAKEEEKVVEKAAEEEEKVVEKAAEEEKKAE